MLSFANIWAFLLLPLPWIVRTLFPPVQRRNPSVQVPFGDRLDEAIRDDSNVVELSRSVKPLVILSLIWLCVVIALARPQWIEAPITQAQPTRDLMLLVDLSASMDREDFTNQTGKTVTRLTAVKEVVGDFLEQRDGDRVGLVVFGDAAYLQAPFSTDLRLSRNLLEECQVGMAGPRTAFGDAIGLGVNLFDESEAPAKTIIALTDGNDTKSQIPPVEAARVASSREITIHTVAIGDPTTIGEDKLDEQALKDVAAETGGSYFFAADRDRLVGIYDQLDEIETREVEVVSYRPRTDLFYLPLAIALLISLAEKCSRVYQDHSDAKVAANPEVFVNPRTGELEVVG